MDYVIVLLAFYFIVDKYVLIFLKHCQGEIDTALKWFQQKTNKQKNVFSC